VLARFPARCLWSSNDDRIWQPRANGDVGTHPDNSIGKAGTYL